MSLRDYDGWRRYAKWKRENYEAWERSVKKQKEMPINFDPQQPKKQNIDQMLGLMPDQKWHRRISFIKSGIRIAGYALIPFNLIAATVVLVISEVVGIIEELV
jgi:hypothetical protein